MARNVRAASARPASRYLSCNDFYLKFNIPDVGIKTHGNPYTRIKRKAIEIRLVFFGTTSLPADTYNRTFE
jgi:hypothetical protein